MTMLKITQDYLVGTPNVQATRYNGKMIIIIHNTATPEATVHNENTYFHRTWATNQSFVHAFVDWTGEAIEHAPFGQVAWGAGYVNKYAFLQVEQCVSKDGYKNRQSAEFVAQYVATKIKESGYQFEDFIIMSHADASIQFGGTDHNDTIVGVGWDDLMTRIKSLTDGQPKEVVEEDPGFRHQHVESETTVKHQHIENQKSKQQQSNS